MADQKLRILFLTFQGDMAGSTNSISYLCKGLAALGHSVHIGIRRESLLWELLEGTNVNRIPMTFNGRMDRVNWRQIRDAVRTHDIQIINAQSSYDRYTSIFANLRYRLNCKVIHTRRQNPLSAGGPLQRKFYTAFTERFVVISEGLKRIFIEKGFPSHHLKVIHNGIPESRYKEWSEEKVQEFRELIQLEEGNKLIGCVSRPKEQEQIIQAVAQLNDPKIELLFAGVDHEFIDPLVEKHQLKNKVHVLGSIPSQDILNIYRLLDLNILASTMDGFGLVLIEAMAMECPVIATNFGGIPDVVQDGVNGLLFDNGDIESLQEKIKSVLYHEQTAERLIKNGKISAYQTFEIKSTIKNYESFFKEITE